VPVVEEPAKLDPVEVIAGSTTTTDAIANPPCPPRACCIFSDEGATKKRLSNFFTETEYGHCIAPPRNSKSRTVQAALQGTWCEASGSVTMVFADAVMESYGEPTGNRHRQTFTIRPYRKDDYYSSRYDVVRLVFDDGEQRINDPRSSPGENTLLFIWSDHANRYHRSASDDCSCFRLAWEIFLYQNP
jgi:hypothetical protein